MPSIADRVWETNSATGTSGFVLTGAKTGYQTFAAGCGSAAVIVPYCAVSGSEWECGYGTFNGTTGITRDKIESSSNSNAEVSFSSAPDVFLTLIADLSQNARLGRQLARLIFPTW